MLDFYTNKQSKIFKNANINFVMTNRYGGVSQIPYNWLNLGYHVGDNENLVSENIQKVMKRFYKEQSLVYLNQIHSNKIINIESNIADSIKLLGDADGIICNDKNIACMIIVADCNPILIHSQEMGVFALLHAGRFGVLGKILSNSIKIMKEKFNVNEKELLVFIGASIRSCCYEVGFEIAQDVINNHNKEAVTLRDNKYFLNMINLLKNEVLSNNIPLNNVEIYPKCSCCNDCFFSYRRDGRTGRFALFASLT